MRTRWDQVLGRPVRALQVGDPRVGVPEIVLVPGLGALGYLRPMVEACAGWTRVHLLDVPGFGHERTARCPAGLTDTADLVAAWLDCFPYPEVVLMGHSTGAQVALRATLAGGTRAAVLVLAGPTFPPGARRLGPLAVRVIRTLRYESLGEVAATFPEYLRGRSGVLTLLRTAMADAPEELVPRLVCPVIVLRGAHDHLAPIEWAQQLVAAASTGEVLTVPGAHNFCYTHPQAASTALRDALLTRGRPADQWRPPP